MKKLYLIANCIYLPLDQHYEDKTSQKYISGSISGTLFPNQIYTEAEIIEKHKNSSSKLHIIEDLHDLTKTWGIKY